ncbi:asparaginase [Longilinea arvoryzae]|uniref:Asparaginase n=1 Tax=Longilinea arvoryzae TaxID=360412 RepID=A0A0S7BDW2_9CHLR|nr:asparaginase [Longilinea arvoryzae]GAP12566.1 asparaginase [Longilinea arvoryzae]
MTYPNYQPLVEVTRGPIVESIHCGAIAVVDVHGHVVASVGDPEIITYPRSTTKPVQALPFVELGGPQHFGLTERELAILCASHSGTDEHFRVVSGIQAKIGVTESDLLCGVHDPQDEATVEAMRQRHELPTSNRHNCSGKHTGMLAQAVLRGLSKKEYIDPNHPVQQLIIKTFSEMTEIPREDILIGIDGCSAPVFALPLRNMAMAFARLAGPSELSPERAAACRQITHAMMSNPDMVAGPGRFDTIAMGLLEGRMFAKGGAEGYQGIGLLPDALGPGSPALGITFKIADGDQGGRARPVVAIEILRQLGLLSQAQIDEHLAALAARPNTNWRKFIVGEIRPSFELKLKRTW